MSPMKRVGPTQPPVGARLSVGMVRQAVLAHDRVRGRDLLVQSHGHGPPCRRRCPRHGPSAREQPADTPRLAAPLPRAGCTPRRAGLAARRWHTDSVARRWARPACVAHVRCAHSRRPERRSSAARALHLRTQAGHTGSWVRDDGLGEGAPTHARTGGRPERAAHRRLAPSLSAAQAAPVHSSSPARCAGRATCARPARAPGREDAEARHPCGRRGLRVVGGGGASSVSCMESTPPEPGITAAAVAAAAATASAGVCARGILASGRTQVPGVSERAAARTAAAAHEPRMSSRPGCAQTTHTRARSQAPPRRAPALVWRACSDPPARAGRRWTPLACTSFARLSRLFAPAFTPAPPPPLLEARGGRGQPAGTQAVLS